jgi:hypothetical protein
MAKRPIRFFNTTGPCNPDDHYMLPPEDRLIGAQLHRYVGDQLYWSLHAPRQTGKTTFLQSWMRELNAAGGAAVCRVTVERCQAIPELERAMPEICNAIRESAETAGLPVPAFPEVSAGSMLTAVLRDWSARVAPKPLVVLFDEVDTLEGGAMVSFLRQLRDGFDKRGPGVFPVSIALAGMRDLRDCLTMAKGGARVNPGSPFNIKADSALIGNFTRENVAALFAQRTAETGQAVAPDALDYVWEQSRGQPWIVNSLFMRATLQVLGGDTSRPVTLEHVREARDRMVMARETHLDALSERLRDPGVRRVMETVISGEADPALAQSRAFELCVDLGLVTNGYEGPSVANPVYREVLVRELSYGAQSAIPSPDHFRWRKPDGGLDMDSLLQEFQKFWRKHSEVWEQKADYTEAFPHLLLMAFLQRLTNGGGRIDREFAAGRGRVDLLVEYAGASFLIEIKIIHGYETPEEVLGEGLAQTAWYRDRVGRDIPCYLVVFDRRPEGKKTPWGERITWSVRNGITVVGA